MAAQTTEQRAFIIWSIANCVEPETIVIQFNKRWKSTTPCSIGDIGACDPRRLTGDWKKYFDQEREIFLDAPAADKRVRMALLNRVILRLESVGGDNASLLKALELMAKEDAGFFVPKATKAASDEKDGPASFTFALDRANADRD
jgi:hypothetical protein